MPQVTAYPPGTPSWVDLGTSDIDAAAAFYSGLFGWEAVDQGPEAGGYRMCLYRGQAVAGLGPQMNPGPPYWTTYVTVADADASEKLIVDAGGTTLLPPMDVMTVGRMGVFLDTTGAAFATWEPRDHIGAGLVNEPNTLTWNELVCRDADAAKAFYAAVFDWTYEVDPAMDGTYTMLQLDGRAVGGLMAMDEQFPAEVPSHWMAYFAVDDADAAIARCGELGGSVIMPATDVPVGRFAVLSDPQGATFSIIAANEFDPPPG